MGSPSGLPDDDPLRALVPVVAPAVVLAVIGVVYPPVLAALLLFALCAATIVAGYLVIRLTRKFIDENCGQGGVLRAWRPGVGAGLRLAVGVLVRWAPFGFLSLLVFGANGLVVVGAERLIELGTNSLQGIVGPFPGRANDAVQAWSYLLPQSLENAVKSTSSVLDGISDLLVNLLAVIRVFFVIEGYFSWIFLIWLTMRSVLYFLARTVLAAQDPYSDAKTTPIEVRFDMKFLR